MKIVRNVLNIILSFCLMLVIAAIISISIVENTILDKEYFLSKLEETEFYLQVSREVENGFENYIYQSGLPEDIIDDLFSEDLLKSDINSMVDYIYDGTEMTISSEAVRETLDNRISEYLSSQSITVNDQGRQNIETFEDLIVKEYENNVKVSSTLYTMANEGISKLNEIDEKIGNIPEIIACIIIILLIVINIKDLLSVINFVGISFLSLGVLIKIGENIISNAIDIDNLVVFSTSISNLIISIYKEILYTLSDNANIYIVGGIIAIIVSSVFRYIFEKKDIKVEGKEKQKEEQNEKQKEKKPVRRSKGKNKESKENK